MNIFYRESTKHIHLNSVNINVSREELRIEIIKLKIDFVLCKFNIIR